MIDVWAATGENRKEALSILRAYKNEIGEGSSGYLFDFVECNQPWIIVEDDNNGGICDAKCTSVNLNDDGETIEVYLENRYDGECLDYWADIDDALGLTENYVYRAIIEQFECNYKKEFKKYE